MARGLVPWSKAGIIITASTRQGAAYAAMMVTGGHGVRLQDDYVNDVPGLAGAVTAASPRWLRLTRAGAALARVGAAGRPQQPDEVHQHRGDDHADHPAAHAAELGPLGPDQRPEPAAALGLADGALQGAGGHCAAPVSVRAW